MADPVETRPTKEGKDPLAEGNTLYNLSNTEEETHYEVGESSADVVKAEKDGARKVKEYGTHMYHTPIPKPIRKIPNKSETELAEAIKTTKRKGR